MLGIMQVVDRAQISGLIKIERFELKHISSSNNHDILSLNMDFTEYFEVSFSDFKHSCIFEYSSSFQDSGSNLMQ